MDPPHASRSIDETYSHNPRSRASSNRVSTTEALLQTLQLAESSPVGTVASFETASYTTSRPPSLQGLASPTYNSPSLPHQPSPFITTQLSHQQPPQHPSSPYQLRAEDPLDANWFGANRSARVQAAPVLHVEPAPEELDTPASSPPLSTVESGAMSAVALPYDQFSMGSRNSFTWPGVEQSNGLLGPDISHHYTSDASLTPPSGSRSVTASPPRSSLTAEQRELKRQRDQARHNTKLQARSQRAGSGSSSVYSPPATLADLATGASTMPVYTTAPPQMSLLTDPPTTQYLPSFSPPIPDHSQAGMFPSHYPPPSYMPEYGYPSAGPSLPSQYGRPMVSDPNMGMYQVPPVMGPGAHDPSGQVRVVTPKPKPQCWEHGCNGRQFSTFSNLLRHQREKSGQASKATCPNCGAEFTRTTARNGHLLHDKCKQKKSG